MRRILTVGLLLSSALQGDAAAAKDRGAPIELLVAPDGSCVARIGAAEVIATPQELQAKLPMLLPNRKIPIRLSGSYEKVPDRCFGPVLATLQAMGYGSISLEMEPPPPGDEIKLQDNPAR